MLLLHQTGSVKIGEVIRYTVTYTPAHDRILPSPSQLYLKIKNTSTVALRAAFIHGPYTLYVSSAPSSYLPNERFEDPRRDGVPEFEPHLKAGGTWYSQLKVPEEVRKTAGGGGSLHPGDDVSQSSVSWEIEIASQVIFSNSAVVHFEMLLGRDEKSLSLGFMGQGSSTGQGSSVPGHVSDHQQSQGAKDGHHPAQLRGVFSKAIRLKVDDTASLWNNPSLPAWDNEGEKRAKESNADAPTENAEHETDQPRPARKQKQIHLVVLTHGLHSNLGADMLYLKESIDEMAKQAKIDSKIRRKKMRDGKGVSGAAATDGELEDENEEEVIVRGFSGNAVKTERGIKYLGKRLARYVLAMTYPDQPYKPITKSATQNLATSLRRTETTEDSQGPSAHEHSSVHLKPWKDKTLAYKITSISFIAHSLGGLIQTYAVAYIQKHSPEFFDRIMPINFIALATPFLGLSNENPIYVKFALDFGLVGRTGQDLGLTWRAPTLARSGWGAIVSGIGDSAHKKAEGERDPGAKPLLRILPTGPAHTALKKFRNRTVYSNVVNDGVVPLRTSCLLFLDWSGLGRVEKARRENGLVGTVANWGWAELTGMNTSSPRNDTFSHRERDDSPEGLNTPTQQGKGDEVPLPAQNETDDDAKSILGREISLSMGSGTDDEHPRTKSGFVDGNTSETETTGAKGSPLDSLFGMFRSNQTHKPSIPKAKTSKMYKLSQTINANEESDSSRAASSTGEVSMASAPPKTTIFEAAGDLLNPPVPTVEWLVDPTSRPRTIFHDRVYHPEDIPPPPLRRIKTSILRRGSSSSITSPTSTQHTFSGSEDDTPHVVDGSAMKVEEKIARAYHRDLSWRKVLVRLQPDAHNNIIVRRKFANAYGWPVVKHLVETHFSDEAVAKVRDDHQGSGDRAKDSQEQPDSEGNETVNTGTETENEDRTRPDIKDIERTNSEILESRDHITSLDDHAYLGLPPSISKPPGSLAQSMNNVRINIPSRPHYRQREDSAQWSERDWGTEDDDDSDADGDKEKRVSWNWTEAIAGKGAASPGVARKGEVGVFLGHTKRNSGLGGDGPAYLEPGAGAGAGSPSKSI